MLLYASNGSLIRFKCGFRGCLYNKRMLIKHPLVVYVADGMSIVFGFDFKEALRMCTDRAYFGRRFADNDMSAVAADPDGIAFA